MNLFNQEEVAFCVGVVWPTQRRSEADDSLTELNSLARTAGATIAGSMLTDGRSINSATFIGKGKIEELAGIVAEKKITLFIFDSELSPSQIRNLEETLKVRVIDRTNLILDIFALHAKSKEGKLQVELAQYDYLYPRLVGQWTHLSKQRGGGVGLRGPGETQLEVDRRRVRERINHLKKSLEKVESSREIHRQKRMSVPIPTVTLVGYTNAGKSTLFNTISGGGQLSEDKLFATLDPKTRKLKLPSGKEVLLTDTVGFIRNLPHQLVEAFKSTFEEARQSDLLLHVVDAAHPQFRQQMEVVKQVLKELELDGIPLIQVMNKMDAEGFEFQKNGKITVSVSALDGTGVESLLAEIDSHLAACQQPVKLFLPHPYGQLLSKLYTHGRILNAKNLVKGVMVEVSLPEKWYRQFASFAVV